MVETRVPGEIHRQTQSHWQLSHIPRVHEAETKMGRLADSTRITYFAEDGVFLRPPHVRDLVKEGYFFLPRYEVWVVKIPLQSTKYTRL